MSKILQSLKDRLAAAESSDQKRKLSPRDSSLIDFSSNDYLGMALTEVSLDPTDINSGSGGSRLLFGTTSYMLEAEKILACFYRAKESTVFSSGYQANLGLLSAVVSRGDYILYDELVHASIRDGIRLSYARSAKFDHNSESSLRGKLERIDRGKGNVFVIVESVYSMDGDIAPLRELANVVGEFGAALIVDEAHSTGLFGEVGEGLVVESGLEEAIFARVHTFGKAIGSHGACVVGDSLLKEAIVNFSRPFIYSTAPPDHYFQSLVKCHERIADASEHRSRLKSLCFLFDEEALKRNIEIVSRGTAIKAVVVPGNSRCRKIAQSLQQGGYDVRAVLSPTVAEGSERLRICLHSFNTEEHIYGVLEKIKMELMQNE